MRPPESPQHPGGTPLLAYVHFPYCLEKCPYCDFVSYKVERPEIPHAGYATAVISELRSRVERLSAGGQRFALQSVFFGGGTPSLWEPRELGRVLAALREAFPGSTTDAATLEAGVEVTVECNPTSLDRDRASALLDVGVNRLSIGVQGLDQERLRFLGRMHDPGGALAALEAALSAGVPRVSGDLIYGLAGQLPAAAADDAGRLVDAGLGHVSAYNLTIEAGTRFGELARRGRLPLAEDAAMVESFFAIDEALSRRGLVHYEISNYGVAGAESRHNLGYWRGSCYLGLGCGAYGTLPDGGSVLRYRNQPLPERYIAACHGDAPLYGLGARVDSVEALSPETRLRERIMLGLRIADGLDLAEAAAEVGAPPWPADRARAAERLVKRGRLVRDGDRLWVPREAWVFADGTAAELF
jgi:putative oxygen-independent coproporphyrinogen III oxidase